MKKTKITAIAVIAVVLAVFGGMAVATQDKYAVQVPNGLALSELRGYEDWQPVAVVTPKLDHSDRSPIPNDRRQPDRLSRQRQAFPRRRQDGEDRMEPEKERERSPIRRCRVPADVDFMVKDSKRFADSGGWGWAVFKYDAASDTFSPADPS